MKKREELKKFLVKEIFINSNAIFKQKTFLNVQTTSFYENILFFSLFFSKHWENIFSN